jgi:16S rRNA (guanine1207-N2)-methyltransferase
LEHLVHRERAYRLQRYPLRQRDPLRAWDAADEYLLRDLTETDLAGRRLLVINDAFGALAVALHAHRPTTWSDSHLARLALRHNLAANDLATEAVVFVPADREPDGPFDLVLAKLPKSLAFWEDTLLRLRPLLAPEARIVAGGMIKHTPRRAHELMDEILGPTRTGLGWKKARLATAAFDPDRRLPARLPDTEYALEEGDLVLRNAPNVFAREHLDLGTRFLLPHLPASDRPLRIADLGCGNGAVTLALARRNPAASVLAVDESYQAVACARANAERAGLAARDLDFTVADGLTETAADALDLVVVNPPFHQAQAVGDAVAWSMLRHAHRALHANGRLLLVGNRHLDYPAKLQRLFGNCRSVEAGPRFVVLEAVKRFD